MLKKLNWSFSFSKIKLNKQIRKNIIYAQAGNIASVLGSFAPVYILSSFGSGIITALSYGQKTANIPNDFITSQFTSISGIRYNELYAQKDFKRLDMVFLETAKFLIFLLVPISVLIFIFSDDIISILFQRGKFDSISVYNSALFLKYLVLILPFLAINGLASRLYMAAQLISYSFWYQIFANLMLILFIWIGIGKFGIIGFPYAMIFQYFINTLVIYLFLKFLLPFIKYYKVLQYGLLIIVLNIAIGYFIVLINEQFSFNSSFIKISICSTLYLSTYLILNILFKINFQTNHYLKLIINKIKSKQNT